MAIMDSLKFELEKQVLELLELGDELLESRILVTQDGFEIISPKQKTLIMFTMQPKMFAFVVKGLMGMWSLFGKNSRARGANFMYLRVFIGRFSKEFRI